MSDTTTILQAECSACGGTRNCGIRGTFKQAGGNEDFNWKTTWHILQCLGCDHVFVQTRSTDSEDYNNYYDEDGSTGAEYNETLKYWPAQSKRKMPDWLNELSWLENGAELERALVEVYGALNNDLELLAAIGMRTSFDIASEILGIESEQSFAQKLSALVSEAHLGQVDRSRVETLVEAGSASIHRGWRPTTSELRTMMDVLEHFVRTTFIEPARRQKLDAEAQKMREKVPARKGRNRKAKPS